MTKQEVQNRVSQNGKPLDLSKFSWDASTNTFSSPEYNLVFDFKGINYCTFKTGFGCIFNTDSGCTFNTDSDCTFNTGSRCTFNDIKERCVLVRRDIFGTFVLPLNKSIKLNDYNISGFIEINKEPEIELIIEINGKESKLSDISEETLIKLRNI